MIHSFVDNLGWPTPPKSKISATKHVVQLVHLNGNHWGATMVSLVYPDRIEPYFYEPLCRPEYRSAMVTRWEDGVLLFLRQWHDASDEVCGFPICESLGWMNRPNQPDFSSCGAMVIAQVHAFIHDDVDFRDLIVTTDHIRLIRLRILWLILCQSTNPIAVSEDTTKTVQPFMNSSTSAS